ncbi:Ig-like domain-containing protein [Pseudomonas sp. IT-232MI5]
MKKDVLILLFFVWIPASLYSVYGWHQTQGKQIVDVYRSTTAPAITYQSTSNKTSVHDSATFLCTISKLPHGIEERDK